MKSALFIIFFTIFLSGCESTPSKSYAQKVSEWQQPKDEQDKNKACGYIRSEIARQQNIATYMSSGQYAMMAKILANDNIAALESKASEFGCSAAFGGQTQPQPAIKACISACKENTSKTSEQCFDACNK
jgi:hypothetical protein